MYFSERLQQFYTLDKIRIYKILEMFQYSSIFYLITVGCSILINRLYYNRVFNKINYHKLMKHLLQIYIELFLIIVVFFYIRKLGLLIPSLLSLYDSSFNPHTTLDYSIHIFIVVLIIELLPNLKKNIEHIGEELYEKNINE